MRQQEKIHEYAKNKLIFLKRFLTAFQRIEPEN